MQGFSPSKRKFFTTSSSPTPVTNTGKTLSKLDELKELTSSGKRTSELTKGKIRSTETKPRKSFEEESVNEPEKELLLVKSVDLPGLAAFQRNGENIALDNLSVESLINRVQDITENCGREIVRLVQLMEENVERTEVLKREVSRQSSRYLEVLPP